MKSSLPLPVTNICGSKEPPWNHYRYLAPFRYQVESESAILYFRIPWIIFAQAIKAEQYAISLKLMILLDEVVIVGYGTQKEAVLPRWLWRQVSAADF